MIIILEGPDGAGKSTLAKEISDKYFADHGKVLEVVHMSYPKNEEEEKEMYNTYVKLFMEKTDFILDRAWFSEMVYGPIVRTHSVLSGVNYQMLNLLAAEKNAVIFYCHGDKDEFWKRCQIRGESYVTSYEKFNHIYQLYEAMFRSPLAACIGLPVYVINMLDDKQEKSNGTELSNTGA